MGACGGAGGGGGAPFAGADTGLIGGGFVRANVGALNVGLGGVNESFAGGAGGGGGGDPFAGADPGLGGGGLEGGGPDPDPDHDPDPVGSGAPDVNGTIPALIVDLGSDNNPLK